MVKFNVVMKNGKYLIQDEDHNTYGVYDTKKEAEDNCGFWQEYYEAPLYTNE